MTGHPLQYLEAIPGVTAHPTSTGHGNPYLARVLGEAAVGASRTDTFLMRLRLGPPRCWLSWAFR